MHAMVCKRPELMVLMVDNKNKDNKWGHKDSTIEGKGEDIIDRNWTTVIS